jgi:hypothetical protein
MGIIMFSKIVLDEKNIETLKKKQKKDSFSIKTLLGNNTLTQSQCIRFGHVFENILKDTLSHENIEVLDTRFLYLNTKGKKKEADLLFKFNNTLYYFEAKTNLNLDSEKCIATDNKISDITNYLNNNKSEFECDNVVSGCITCWYETNKELNNKLKTKIFFMKDFFELINYKVTQIDYNKAMLLLGEKISE